MVRPKLGFLVAATLVAAGGLGAYLLAPRLRLDNPTWDLVVLTGFVLAAAVLARGYLNTLLVPRVRVGHMRYLAHKGVGAATFVIALVALAVLWVEDPTTLGVSLGIVGAGLAVALQKPITSAFALVVILTNRLFRVGDRVMIGKTTGDVIDVHLFHTKLMEVGEWMEGESWTGRIVTVPNYLFLEERLHNYTKDFHFLWDTLTIPVTLDSDWRKAERILADVMHETTGPLEDRARAALEAMSADYLVPSARTEPRTFVQPTDDWIELLGRYVTTPRGRRGVRSRMLKQVLDRLEAEDDITIASERLRLSDLPTGSRHGATGA